MDRLNRAVDVFIVAALAAAAVFATIAANSPDKDRWVLAAWLAVVLATTVFVAYYLLQPMLNGMSARRRRKFAEADVTRAEALRLKAAAQQPSGTPVLEIVKALYGVRDNWIDLTHVVAALVEDGKVNVKVWDPPFPDHIVGVPKTLQVQYKVDGEVRDTGFADGEMVVLP